MTLSMNIIHHHGQPTVLGKNNAMKIVLDKSLDTNATKKHNRFTLWNSTRGGVQIDLAAFSMTLFVAVVLIAWVVGKVS